MLEGIPQPDPANQAPTGELDAQNVELIRSLTVKAETLGEDGQALLARAHSATFTYRRLEDSGYPRNVHLTVSTSENNQSVSAHRYTRDGTARENEQLANANLDTDTASHVNDTPEELHADLVRVQEGIASGDTDLAISFNFPGLRS